MSKVNRYRLLNSAHSIGEPVTQLLAPQTVVLESDYQTLCDERDRLREALEAMMKLVDDGLLVRNIANDHIAGWSIRALPIVQTLQQAQTALTPAGQRWTRERPTEPGWYWWRIAPGHYAVIERYDKDADGGLVMYGKNGQGELIKHPVVSGEFQGPLTPNEATE